MGVLYRVTGPNGKTYVGITSGTLRRRWSKHVTNAQYGSPGCPVLAAAIRKYGPEAFDVRTLVIAEWPLLVELERKLITRLNCKSPNGYNLTDGGDGTHGYKASDETRARISAAASKRTLSQETRARIGAALRGKKRPAHAEFMRRWQAERKRNRTGV